MKSGHWLAGIALALLATPALAGPCTQDISELGKKLSDSQAVGAPTTGVVSGSVDTSKVDGAKTAAAQAGKTSTTEESPSLNKDDKTGGLGGVQEMNATAANRATSPADVRREQAGKPVAAADPHNAGTADHGDTAAKNLLSEARALDAKDDAGCKDKIEAAKKAMN